MKASISVAAKQLGVSQDTLRRWERAGKITAERTARGHRRFDLSKLLSKALVPSNHKQQTLAYARVSNHDQKLLQSLKEAASHV